MTRKDFIAIADIQLEIMYQLNQAEKANLIVRLSNSLAARYPNFDRVKFFNYCEKKLLTNNVP